MAQAKNMINDLKLKLEHIKSCEWLECNKDWGNKEMSCVVLAIFGGNITEYWHSFGLKEVNKKSVELIYNFQTEIYNKMLSRKLSKKEYEYSYLKSKALLERHS